MSVTTEIDLVFARTVHHRRRLRHLRRACHRLPEQLVVGSILFAFPVDLMVRTSLLRADMIMAPDFQWIPRPIMWQNYLEVLRTGLTPVSNLCPRACFCNG